jgi:hypothetical protein
MKNFLLFAILFSIISNSFAIDEFDGSNVANAEECSLVLKASLVDVDHLSENEFPSEPNTKNIPHEGHCHHNHCYCLFYQSHLNFKMPTEFSLMAATSGKFIPEAHLRSLFRPPIS